MLHNNRYLSRDQNLIVRSAEHEARLRAEELWLIQERGWNTIAPILSLCPTWKYPSHFLSCIEEQGINCSNLPLRIVFISHEGRCHNLARPLQEAVATIEESGENEQYERGLSSPIWLVAFENFCTTKLVLNAGVYEISFKGKIR